MRIRWSIPVVALLAVGVGAAAYLRYDAFGPGLSAAARNTARFSGVIFALALAARSPRFPALFARREEAFWAFVTAHVVHYAFVAAVAVLDTANPLHQMNVANAVIFGSGFSMLAAAALTAGPASGPFRSRAHAVFFYALGLSFAVALAAGTTKSVFSAAVLAALALGFLVRVIPARAAAADAVSA